MRQSRISSTVKQLRLSTRLIAVPRRERAGIRAYVAGKYTK